MNHGKFPTLAGISPGTQEYDLELNNTDIEYDDWTCSFIPDSYFSPQSYTDTFVSFVVGITIARDLPLLPMSPIKGIDRNLTNTERRGPDPFNILSY